MRIGIYPRIFLIFIILLILATGSSCSFFSPSFKGEVVQPLTTAPAINMPDQNGNPFQLNAARGKITLAFFGFTNCVDECPLALAHIKLARELLGESAEAVQVVLVSTDPVRDTPMALKDYLAKFDPSYVGITGSFVDLQKIWDGYGVEVLDGGETHTSLIYVVDRQGNLRLRMAADTSPEDMAADLKILLASE
jgi:protein SCO1/2